MKPDKQSKTIITRFSASYMEKFGWGCGSTGRALFRWWRRVHLQIAFLGRLLLTWNQYHDKAKGFFLRQVMETVYACGFGCLWIVAFLGFITGYLWGIIWFGQLSNIGGLDSLAVLFLRGQIDEVAVIATMVVVILKYCSRVTLEMAAMKTTGQMQTIRLLGISPEYCMALPKLFGTVIAFFALVAFFCFFTISGVGLTVWRFTMRMPTEFFYEMSRTADYGDFIKLTLKSIAVGFLVPTISLYNG